MGEAQPINQGRRPVQFQERSHEKLNQSLERHIWGLGRHRRRVLCSPRCRPDMTQVPV